MFDLESNPTMEERLRMVREKPIIAAEHNTDGSFRGVFMPKQQAAGGATQLIAIACKHHHPTLFHALLCANTVGQEMIDEGLGEIISTS